MLMVKIAHCFEVFCIPIWNKWFFRINWKIICRGGSPPQPPLKMRAVCRGGWWREPPLQIRFLGEPPTAPTNCTYFQGRLRGWAVSTNSMFRDGSFLQYPRPIYRNGWLFGPPLKRNRGVATNRFCSSGRHTGKKWFPVVDVAFLSKPSGIYAWCLAMCKAKKLIPAMCSS